MSNLVFRLSVMTAASLTWWHLFMVLFVLSWAKSHQEYRAVESVVRELRVVQFNARCEASPPRCVVPKLATNISVIVPCADLINNTAETKFLLCRASSQNLTNCSSIGAVLLSDVICVTVLDVSLAGWVGAFRVICTDWSWCLAYFERGTLVKLYQHIGDDEWSAQPPPDWDIFSYFLIWCGLWGAMIVVVGVLVLYWL
jgi:hypothetical protein